MSLMRSTITSVWCLISRFLEWFGDLGLFAWQVVSAAVRRPFEGRELLRQLDEIGSKSLPLVALAGAAIGAVLSLESRSSLVRFGAKAMLPRALRWDRGYFGRARFPPQIHQSRFYRRQL